MDCGSYHGDTIREFIKHLNGMEYGFIIAFEADAANYAKLSDYVKKEKLKNVLCVNKGTWNRKGKIRFVSGTEEGCRISEDGDCIIRTETIDNIVRDKRVTFIKMDIEGAELRSLQGAEKTIERNHPRLAISIYHSAADMTDIIIYLHARYPFYKLFVRHYTYFYADTVVYAIDEKKE